MGFRVTGPIERHALALAADYLNRRIQLREFALAVAEATHDVLRVEPAAARTVGRIELLLSEYALGHRDAESLRAELGKVVAARIPVTEGSTASRVRLISVPPATAPA